MFIIEFFEYTLDGWLYFIYFVFMIFCAFSCLGVVGDRVSKKKQAELIAKKEQAAQEEYKKAHETIEKQANATGIDMTLDPSLKKTNNETVEAGSGVELVLDNPTSTTEDVNANSGVELVIDAPVTNSASDSNVGELVIDTPTPAVEAQEVVTDNSIPVVNTNVEEDNTKEAVSNVLVIDDGTSGSST